MSSPLRPGVSRVGTAGSGYTWGRGSLILHRPSSGLHTSLLQWSSAWPPFTSPQGALHWNSVTMPKVIVPGEYGQTDFWFERALSPVERGFGSHFQRLILHWHMAMKMNWGELSPNFILWCFFDGMHMKCKNNKCQNATLMSVYSDVWKEMRVPQTLQKCSECIL